MQTERLRSVCAFAKNDHSFCFAQDVFPGGRGGGGGAIVSMKKRCLLRTGRQTDLCFVFTHTVGIVCHVTRMKA